jgi:hypothetical protein
MKVFVHQRVGYFTAIFQQAIQFFFFYGALLCVDMSSVFIFPTVASFDEETQQSVKKR